MKYRGIDKEKEQILNRLLSYINFKDNKEYTINFIKSNELKTEKKGLCINAYYKKDSEIGFCLLNSIFCIEKNIDKITPENDFINKGIMIDLSRGGALKKEKIEKIMDYMYLFGLNSLMIYLEDMIEIDDLPYFGYLRGRYKKEELKEIVNYGNTLGIEVIPCIQTLGHLEQYLKWKEAENIRDTMKTLCAENEASYVFTEKIIKTCKECFNTDKIHIGMDEALDMGTGNYFLKNGYKDKFKIFENHLKNLKSITDKYYKKVMIWSDMFFRISSSKGKYYDTDVDFPDFIKKAVPENYSLVYWDYDNIDTGIFNKMIKKHKEITDNITFACGLVTWRGFVPKISEELKNVKGGVCACRENNIEDIYMTLWGDDGTEADYFYSLPGLLRYSMYIYFGDRNFANDFSELVFSYSFKDFGIMEDILYTDIDKKRIYVKEIIYTDILVNIFEYDINNSLLKDKYKNLYEKLKGEKPRKKTYIPYIDFLEKLCKVAYLKLEIIYNLRKYYDMKDKEKLRALPFDYLISEYEELRKLHRNLWFENNKSYGFENLDIRYGGALARCVSAKDRISDYVNGRIENIEELDEKRLPAVANLNCYNWYNNINSPYTTP